MGELSDNPGLTEAEFVERYGNTKLQFGTQPLTLRKALEFEDMFCAADQSARQDEARRLSYLARMIGEASLDPEHRYLLPANDLPAEPADG